MEGWQDTSCPFSAHAWEINRCQDLKTIIHGRLVLLFYSWKALHV
jgi:hypothetical protein